MEPIRSFEAHNNGRSLGELFRQLSSELGTLMRQESELARAEIRDKATKLGASLAELGAGAVVLFAGFLVLLQSAVYALAGPLDSLALAALLVGGVTLAIGIVLLLRGRSQLKADELAPTRTLRSLRRDAALANELRHDPTATAPSAAGRSA
jgi:hypothetical protein